MANGSSAAQQEECPSWQMSQFAAPSTWAAQRCVQFLAEPVRAAELPRSQPGSASAESHHSRV